MENNYIKNKDFVLWIITKDEQLNNYWTNYIIQNPEELKNIEEAKKEIQSLRVKKYVLNTTDKIKLKKQIFSDISKSKQKNRFYLFTRYAAACIILLTSIISFIYISNQKNDLYSIEDHNHIINENQTEIELIINQDKKINLSNNITVNISSISKEKIKDTTEIKEAEQTIDNINIKENSLYTLKVPRGKRSSIILEDGTKVWINSETILQFPEKFEDKERIIYVDGEIFLEVAHNKNAPFHVKTKQMDICVLGTSFNVSAYASDNEEMVVLKEGSVKISGTKGLEKILKPNERLTANDENLIIETVDINDYISWKEGYLQFHDKNLSEVLTQLSRYYKIDFNYDTKIGQMKCFGKLILFDTPEEVMETLKSTLGIEYKINENKIIIDVEPLK